MRRSLHTFLLASLAVLTLVGAPATAVAQEASSGGAQRSSKRAREGRQEDARKRWERMPKEKRELMRERFETYRSMDEAQRKELRARFERLREVERDVQAELPEDVRARLEGLAPGERRELLSEHLDGALHERGRRVRGRLPPDARERFEAAGPDERRNLMGSVRSGSEGPGIDGALRDLGRKLELSGEEIRGLEQLPGRKKREALLGLRRRELSQRVEREGLPAWLPSADWEAWRELSDRGFFEAFQGAREAGDPGEEKRHRLRRLLRPEPEALLEVAGLPEGERRGELRKRQRARALRTLEENPGLLPDGELEVLKGLEGRAFHERLRGHLGFDERRGRRERGERGDRRGPRRGDERLDGPGPGRGGPPRGGPDRRDPRRGGPPRGGPQGSKRPQGDGPRS